MKAEPLDVRLSEAYDRATQILSASAARALLRKPVFHGTRHATLIKKFGFKPSTGGEFGPGIYFSDFEPTAEFYALRVATGPEEPRVIRCHVSVVRPFLVTKTDWIALTRNKTPKTVQRRIVDLGYDGVVGLGLTGLPQVILFAPEQAKCLPARSVK